MRARAPCSSGLGVGSGARVVQGLGFAPSALDQGLWFRVEGLGYWAAAWPDRVLCRPLNYTPPPPVLKVLKAGSVPQPSLKEEGLQIRGLH